MAEGKDKFDINNDQKLKENNLDKDDGTIAKTEMHEGYDHEQYNKLDRDQLEDPISEPTADGVIFPGNDDYDMAGDNLRSDHLGALKVSKDTPIHDTEERADADIIPGDVSKVELNQGLGKYVKDEAPEMTKPIHDTEERADADIIPGDVPKVELNQGLGDYVKDGDNLSSDHIAKTEILDGQPEQGILAQANGAPNVSGEVVNMADTEQDILAQANGAPNVSGDVVNMADMHSHMDDAAEHQVPEGPPQNPQGMGLDRLGTQFDEDGMGDMHKPDDPNDGGEVV